MDPSCLVQRPEDKEPFVTNPRETPEYREACALGLGLDEPVKGAVEERYG